MKKQKMEKSMDGKCPYCGSDYVVKTCAFGDDISQDKMDEERSITYKCYTCNKDFYCTVED
ncbi:MAG: hypothetical protein ACERK6_08265 [Candidatus Aminicenantaceae bacterium]